MRYQEQQNIVAPAGMSYGVRELVDPMEYAECAPSLADGSPALKMAINADPKWFGTSSPVANGRNWGDCAMPDSSGGQGNYWHASSPFVGCSPGNSLNGKPSIDFEGTSFLRFPSTNPGTPGVNLNAFSLVCVYGVNQAKTNVLFSLNTGNYDRMLYTGSNGMFTLAGVTSGSSLGDVDPVWVDASAKLVVLTFSTTRGVSLRRNGALRVADPARTTPPAPSNSRFFIGGYDSIDPANIMNGSMANIRRYNFDLSAPENGAALKAVEDAAIARFNLIRGA